MLLTQYAKGVKIMIISGRFTLVSENEQEKIVALIGKLHYHDLTKENKKFIAAFYNLAGHAIEFLPDYPAKNRQIYTGFLKIKKG